MKISIDKQLYEDITRLAYFDELENQMLIGGVQIGDTVDTSISTFKWYTPEEFREDKNVRIVKETVVAKNLKDLINQGYNTAVMITTHPCKEEKDDWVYASLSNDDIKESKNVGLMCDLQGLNFYSAVATCNGLYFWVLDPKHLKPIQVECEVDGEDVTKKVPSTLKEIVEKMQK